MTCLIEALRCHGAESAHLMAIDPVVDFPVDYRLLFDLVTVLAYDLEKVLDTARPVAVQLDRSVGLALLDLALMAAGIPQLALPHRCSSGEAAAAMARCGAQAVYLKSTATMRLAQGIPMLPMPQGTARIVFERRRRRSARQVQLPVKNLVAIARSLVEQAEPRHFERHLALQPTSRLSEAVAGFYPTMLAGGTYVMPPFHGIGLTPRYQPNFYRLTEAIAELRITSLVASPKLLAGLISALETRRRRLPTLARIIVDGPLLDEQAERGHALGLCLRTIEDLTRGAGLPVCDTRLELSGGPARS